LNFAPRPEGLKDLILEIVGPEDPTLT